MILLLAQCSASIGFVLSAISPSVVVANAIGPPILIILVLFGGFYINVSSLPVGSDWVQYISFIAWGFKVASYT